MIEIHSQYYLPCSWIDWIVITHVEGMIAPIHPYPRKMIEFFHLDKLLHLSKLLYGEMLTQF
jgi:hypothetical protein